MGRLNRAHWTCHQLLSRETGPGGLGWVWAFPTHVFLLPQAGVFLSWPGLRRVLVAEFMGLVILREACCSLPAVTGTELCGPARLWVSSG